uniref:Uncharacterized protein n=1 Tax=Tanacetum cinerariifolium TaxID=118510 RepID=A0A6L2JKX7_TANCI|nr:hypothetical protein [Tanacetum cinerariifolium]
MVRLWWLLGPQPARSPTQRWRQTVEHSEAPLGVTPPQPDTTWCGCGGCTVVRPPPRSISFYNRCNYHAWKDRQEIGIFLSPTTVVVANPPPTAHQGGGSGWKSRRCCCGAGGGGDGGRWLESAVGARQCHRKTHSDTGYMSNWLWRCWFLNEVDMVTGKWPEMVAGGSGCHGGEERRCMASVVVNLVDRDTGSIFRVRWKISSENFSGDGRGGDRRRPAARNGGRDGEVVCVLFLVIMK